MKPPDDLQALQASEARLRQIIERNADGMVVVDRDGAIRFANPAAEALMGRQARELVGQTFGIPVLPGETTEIDVVRAGGDLRVAEMRVVEIEWEGCPAFLASLHDLTERKQLQDALRRRVEELAEMNSRLLAEIEERKRAERRLRDSEERFRLLVEHVQEYAIILLDPRARVASWNEGAERILGYRDADIEGEHVACFFPPDDASQGVVHLALEETLRTGRSCQDKWLVRADGSRFWASGVVTAIRDDHGQLHGFVLILRDLTEQQRLKEALEDRVAQLAETDRRKNEFLAMLGHELRNPLAPIRNALHVIQLPGVPPGDAAQMFELMDRQVNHLARLVDDLLDMARITRGKIALQKRIVDFADLVARAAGALRSHIEAFGQRLHVSLPQAPVMLEADPMRMEQVVSNLLNNACKYTESGGEIWVTLREDGRQSILQVRDSGIGIAPDLLPRVFDLFAQADRSLARSQGGLGIGLTLVRGLVEMHGGNVSAASPGVGKGSEFTVRLPLFFEAVQREVASIPPQRNSSPPIEPRRILIVDDNIDSAESLALLFKLSGHQVQTTYHGLTAIEEALTHRPELVFCDIGLPDIDGYEVARRLRRKTRRDEMLLIALTGYGQEEDRCRSAEAGFDHHLVKPVDLKSIERLLARVELGRSTVG